MVEFDRPRPLARGGASYFYGKEAKRTESAKRRIQTVLETVLGDDSALSQAGEDPVPFYCALSLDAVGRSLCIEVDHR